MLRGHESGHKEWIELRNMGIRPATCRCLLIVNSQLSAESRVVIIPLVVPQTADPEEPAGSMDGTEL